MMRCFAKHELMHVSCKGCCRLLIVVGCIVMFCNVRPMIADEDSPRNETPARGQPNEVDAISVEVAARVNEWKAEHKDESGPRFDADLLSFHGGALAEIIDEHITKSPESASRLLDDIMARPDEGLGHTILVYLIPSLSRSGDRERLLKILAERCPSNYHCVEGGYSGIESRLVFSNGTPEHIKLLFDAYRISTKSEVKVTITQALRRGFYALGIREEDNDTQVRKCSEWLAEHKGGIKLNPRYARLYREDTFKTIPLFIVDPPKAD
jgi:hypothetical protein